MFSKSLILSVIIQLHAFAVCEQLYGDNPLEPSPQSAIGQYLERTGATTVERAFELEHNGPLGDERLVVTVSNQSYQEFENLFINDSILFLFHDPNATVLNAAYDGKKGFMARLRLNMRFTFSGAMLIPICLTPQESQRVKEFFDLALSVSQSFDFLLRPWLLQDEFGENYMPILNTNSLSEWFVRLPIGDADETQQRVFYNLPEQADPELESQLRFVWASPFSHKSLGEVLSLQRFIADRELDTPGLIASSLLATVPSERIPAVFRFVNDHTEQLPYDFNNWFNVEFDPNNADSDLSQTLQGKLNETMEFY